MQTQRSGWGLPGSSKENLTWNLPTRKTGCGSGFDPKKNGPYLFKVWIRPEIRIVSVSVVASSSPLLKPQPITNQSCFCPGLYKAFKAHGIKIVLKRDFAYFCALFDCLYLKHFGIDAFLNKSKRIISVLKNWKMPKKTLGTFKI